MVLWFWGPVFVFFWFQFRETEKKHPKIDQWFNFFLIFETCKKSLPFHSDLKHRLKHFDDNLSETDQSFLDHYNRPFAKFTYFLCELRRIYEASSLFFLVSWRKVPLFLRKNMSFLPVFLKNWGFTVFTQFWLF